MGCYFIRVRKRVRRRAFRFIISFDCFWCICCIYDVDKCFCIYDVYDVIIIDVVVFDKDEKDC